MRWPLLLLLTVCAIDAAHAADQLAIERVRRPAAVVRLPDGLPRTHYRARTTITYADPVVVAPIVEEPDVLFTPTNPVIPYVPPLVRAPLLPGSSTLPGYYGSSHSYDYQGPYYGGPYVSYYDRLPYACGVYGYC